jgi:hypothetical protein
MDITTEAPPEFLFDASDWRYCETKIKTKKRARKDEGETIPKFTLDELLTKEILTRDRAREGKFFLNVARLKNLYHDSWKEDTIRKYLRVIGIYFCKDGKFKLNED